MNKTYYDRKAQGICVQCGKNPVTQGHAYCEECRARNRENSKKRYAQYGASEKRRAYSTEWVRKKREIRQRDGRCIACGQPRASGSKCYCEKCLEKARAYAARYRAKEVAKMMDSV